MSHLLEDRDVAEKNAAYEETATGIAELDAFVDQGLITGIYGRLSSGKEGTIYCCRAHPCLRRRFAAAKVYRRHAAGSYKMSATYFEGRERELKPQVLRAIQSRSRFGKDIAEGLWVGAEYTNLQRLARVGASVPVPIAASGSAILMEYIGNGAGPAPQLIGCSFSLDEAEEIHRQILKQIELMLRAHLVHGDLSPYNVLLWKGEARIIDLPQAVDPRFNHAAFDLLQRDIGSVTDFLSRFGVIAPPENIATRLWERYRRAEL
ncbi:hypothetical protein JW848_04575 [Candidatus Bipolaricaulota bacterium]|nr:hypothetical protein [Candidatus Bipolaricaulota bacterium]